MKGYTPPPRMSVSNEPAPITRNITITEGISVKDLAEKLDIRAKDLIARLLSRGVFATINQTLDAELASEMARFFGADTNVISFEEQAQKDIADASEGGEEGGVEATPRPPVRVQGIVGEAAHFVAPAPSRMRGSSSPSSTSETKTPITVSRKAAVTAARLPCPTDLELVQPVSAGALSNAFARAKACFARQVGSGRSWRDVR